VASRQVPTAGFDPWAGYEGFLIDKLALEQFFS
jgi:hypothetical protein